MIAIIDYGVGNLFSLSHSLHSLGAECEISGDIARLKQADKLIFPGVGAFGDAAAKLRQSNLDNFLREQAAEGVPILGICLGMQLLFEKGYEYGEHQGLGLIPGTVRPMADIIPKELKIPHIGWNSLHFTGKPCALAEPLQEGDWVYFVHSYYGAECEDSLIATTDYGAPLTAMVAKDRVYGCQFHPEKSGPVGLKILQAFCRL